MLCVSQKLGHVSHIPSAFADWTVLTARGLAAGPSASSLILFKHLLIEMTPVVKTSCSPFVPIIILGNLGLQISCKISFPN
jgi:hypothetical protein